MDRSSSSKRLRLRHPDQCLACEHELGVGDEVIWDRPTRTFICAACAGDAAVVDGHAGASAQQEYERRRARREQHARDKLGGLGVLLAGVVDEPASTKAWKQGGDGEARTAARLAKHLDGSGVSLLHDRRIPGHGQANIDHIAIGPGGITVIDTKTHRGQIRVDRIGGLFSPRRSVLLIGGRDQTRLVDRVERHIEYVRSALSGVGDGELEILGALCFPKVDGLPLFGRLSVRGVVIDGPKPVARLAARAGAVGPEAIHRVWRDLGSSFPPACRMTQVDRLAPPRAHTRIQGDDRDGSPETATAASPRAWQTRAPINRT
jgi:hypothetical protein